MNTLIQRRYFSQMVCFFAFCFDQRCHQYICIACPQFCRRVCVFVRRCCFCVVHCERPLVSFHHFVAWLLPIKLQTKWIRTAALCALNLDKFSIILTKCDWTQTNWLGILFKTIGQAANIFVVGSCNLQARTIAWSLHRVFSVRYAMDTTETSPQPEKKEQKKEEKREENCSEHRYTVLLPHSLSTIGKHATSSLLEL